MADLFEDKAADWDSRPIPAQISDGVGTALIDSVRLTPQMRVMDFGAGTGLVCSQVAPHVEKVYAVDISEAMLAQLASKTELAGKVETVCQNILQEPLGKPVDLIVSAMAMHHVEDTAALIETFSEHLQSGGQVALADLDKEDGSFHPADTEGVFHNGIDRESLRALLKSNGFGDIKFSTAVTVTKEDVDYPIFFATASKL